MMDLRTLEYVNRQATRRSQRERSVPTLIEPEDVQAYNAGDDRAIRIPYIGYRTPVEEGEFQVYVQRFERR